MHAEESKSQGAPDMSEANIAVRPTMAPTVVLVLA